MKCSLAPEVKQPVCPRLFLIDISLLINTYETGKLHMVIVKPFSASTIKSLIIITTNIFLAVTHHMLGSNKLLKLKKSCFISISSYPHWCISF